MTVIDKSVKIKIGGKTYSLLYTVKALMEAEQDCTEDSLLLVISNPTKLAAFRNCYALLKAAMLAGNPDTVTEDNFDEILGTAVEEYKSCAGLAPYCVEAIKKSGLLIRAKKNQGAADNKEV